MVRKYGPRVLQLLGETFGIDYVLPKMVNFAVLCTVLLGNQDMVNVPGKVSAMENWGLSMYNREAILFDQV